jgi:IS4 transposase
MVSGYKKDEEFKRGFKYATLTLVGEHPPIILGIEPVKEDSQWEEDDAPSYPKASLVRRLLDKAQRFVDLDEVLLDRGFYSHGVFTSIHNHDIVYTIPVPNYEPDREAIEKIKSHPSAKGGVNHNIRVGQTGGYHTAEYLYVPTKGASSDDAYAAFITNRDHVAPEDAEAICNRYRRRWDIENQYKSIKSFLPKTSSKDYRVRFCNFALTSLIYNLWRLTDFLIKIAIDKPIRDPPVISARTFVRALSNFLRDIG